MIHSQRTILALLPVFSCVFFIGCGLGDDNEMEVLATSIIDITVTPFPLVAGDTAFVKCTFKDSLDTGLIFSWRFDNGQALDSRISTETCEAEWISPLEADTFEHLVRISKVGYSAEEEPFVVITSDL